MIVRGDARMELHQVKGAVPVPIDREAVATTLKSAGINHLGLVVDDVAAMLAALQTEGVDISMPLSEVPNGSGDRLAFFLGNDRMLVELYQSAREQFQLTKQ